MKKKLAIICAGSDQIPLVKKAKEMGVETHCFAWDKEGYTQCKGIADYFHPISIVEKEQILEACKNINIDGVTSIMNDYAVPTVAYVAQNMGLIGNGYEDSLILVSKFKMRQTFLKNGVNSPHFDISEKGQIPDLSEFQYPLIVKPVDGRASIGVIKADSGQELQHAIFLANKGSFIGQVIIEEFIGGSEHNVDVISWKGKHYIVGINDKEFASTDRFILLGEHYPSQLSLNIQEKMKAETKKVLDAINFNYGASSTQFKVTETGEIFVIEVNPRMGGDYSFAKIELNTGYDYVKGVINVALGKFEEPLFTCNKFSGSYFLHQETEWAREIIENKDSDPDIIEATFYEEEICGKRNGYFIYQSEQKRRWGNNI